MGHPSLVAVDRMRVMTALIGAVLLLGGCSEDAQQGRVAAPTSVALRSAPKPPKPKVDPLPEIPAPVEEPVQYNEEEFEARKGLSRADLEQRLKRARRTLRRLKRRNEQLEGVASKALVDLAILNDMEGNSQEAIAAFERYLELKPQGEESDEIRENLESLRSELSEANQ